MIGRRRAEIGLHAWARRNLVGGCFFFFFFPFSHDEDELAPTSSCVRWGTVMDHWSTRGAHAVLSSITLWHLSLGAYLGCICYQLLHVVAREHGILIAARRNRCVVPRKLCDLTREPGRSFPVNWQNWARSVLQAVAIRGHVHSLSQWCRCVQHECNTVSVKVVAATDRPDGPHYIQRNLG
jgi:hypothetical protein